MSTFSIFRQKLLFMLRFVIFMTFCAFSLTGSAQAVITFELEGLKAPGAILAYYYGDKTFKADSVAVDTATGGFTFKVKALKPGLFFIIANNDKIMDFMVTKPEDSIFIKGKLGDLSSLNVSGSPENTAFLELYHQTGKVEGQINTKREMMDMVAKATRNDPEVMKPMEQELRNWYTDIDSINRAYSDRYPTHLYAKMLRASSQPDAPVNLPRLINEKINPDFVSWMQKHYFDQTDFSNDNLLNSDLWFPFFMDYLTRWQNPTPDSLVKSIDWVIAKMPKNGAFYEFSIIYLTQLFEMNPEPGADRLFVHMADTYHKKDETPWLNLATYDQLKYKADMFRPVLTGNIAPDFSLQDKNGVNHTLYGVQSPYTLLIFFSPLCKHCMEVIPDVYQTWLDARAFGLAAVTVSTDNQFNYWKQFQSQQSWDWLSLADPTGNNEFDKIYNNYNLPVIFLLDKDKKIIRKRIKPADLRTILQKTLKNK